MQEFRADLHIHSKYSRATSSKLTPRHLAAWAAVKGITVLGTGDFTHARWRDELKENLVLDEESGLYALRAPLRIADEIPDYPNVPDEAAMATRFMLQAEVSSIYKRGGKVRKVHNCIYMPAFASAEKLSLRLEGIGNLASDGRPILGLDSRDLLEMVLETHPQAFMIPAHVWTPWFSVFGSKSGFDDIADCYGDLTDEIFALETGLSSDPEMNRMWSALDRFRLVSNSDAHSGENLGREANLFRGAVSYEGIYRALKHGDGATRFDGTLEFYPEEGKYHLDGHRKCDVVFSPEQTRELGGLCPKCGKPLTVGVLYRVCELADRSEPVYRPDERFHSLIPLPEILGEIVGAGPRTRKVVTLHAQAVARFGSELAILEKVPEDELARFNPSLGEAVARMRRGDVIRQGGYDGEYGVVRVFAENERRDLTQGALYAVPAVPRTRKKGKIETEAPIRDQREAHSDPAEQISPQSPAGTAGADDRVEPAERDIKSSVSPPAPPAPPIPNPAQEAAVAAGPGPVCVLAGPGSGKTHTLVSRVTHLLEHGVSPRSIVAVTFTRRAASEMDERLRARLGEDAVLPRTDTLHALAFELWHRTHVEAPVLLGEEAARRVFLEANPDEPRWRDAFEALSLLREKRQSPEGELAAMHERYFRQKSGWNLADYTDLLEFWLEQIQTGLYSSPYAHILVDEIQDLSPLQLELVRALCPTGQGFFGIGDPDQSIYGFRGAHGDVLGFFSACWPDLSTISLALNYRSAPVVLDSAACLMQGHSRSGTQSPTLDITGHLCLFEAPSAESEATWIAGQVRDLLGSGSHTLDDNRSRQDIPGQGEHAPGDIAVLVRMKALVHPLQRALKRVGVNPAVPEAEGFWKESRNALIIREAGRLLGVSDAGEEGPDFAFPDKLLTKGPTALAAYLENVPPFDLLFWRSRAFKELVKAYEAYGGWAGLINWVNLQTELELVRSRAEKVQIMSLHAAKGLEFRSVFVAGVEDGILPFAGTGMLTGQAGKDVTDVDEERRLLFVGMTRARQNLFLSCAGKRLLFGKEIRLQPSRFLADLPLENFHRSALVARQKRDEKQLQLFGV